MGADSNYDRKVAAVPTTPAYNYNPLPQSPVTPTSSTPLSGVGQYQTVDPGFTKVSYTKLDPSTKETIAAQ